MITPYFIVILLFSTHKFVYFWTLHRMYTSHSRRMPVILMPLSQTVSTIFSHKPHTEVFFPLHHHTKFPVHTESLRRCLAKPVLRTSPSSRLRICSSVQIPCSKLPSFHNRFCIFSSDKSFMTSCLNDTTMNWKKQWFRWEKNFFCYYVGNPYRNHFFMLETPTHLSFFMLEIPTHLHFGQKNIEKSNFSDAVKSSPDVLR